jgi:hypothetical protein
VRPAFLVHVPAAESRKSETRDSGGRLMTPFRLGDDEPDQDEEDDDEFDEDEDKSDDEEEEEGEDDEEEETWQVCLILTSPIELPRLASIFQLSQAGLDSAGSRRSHS